ncbi:ground-like domain-containing protein [Ditylenchus destructor]|uniref:Ground-like domain-containing protein n=1 Tax=Ditylenchus destructor TaxID=166010 RepID=A0AAD4NE29_9BILA|nr:ground-like domain-containing protein [Ditylenchus destructor]
MLFVILALVATTLPLASSFGFGGGCGCAPPPPPPPCLPSLPPPCLPQIQMPQFCPPPISLPSLPSPCGCGRKKRAAPTISGHSGVSSETLCNNQDIRKIILKNLSEDPILSKNAIHSELKSKLGQSVNWVVVCSQGAFSFVADSHNYCIDGSNSQTCYVFQA